MVKKLQKSFKLNFKQFGKLLYSILFSKIDTFRTDNNVNIAMPRLAQESSIYLFPLIVVLS